VEPIESLEHSLREPSLYSKGHFAVGKSDWGEERCRARKRSIRGGGKRRDKIRERGGKMCL